MTTTADHPYAGALDAYPMGTTLTPGDDEWRTRMSASKIAAVVGGSPYESRFSLWHKMAGLLPWDDGQDADEKARGHYIEPALRQWWRDAHPDVDVVRTRSWVHAERPWQIATPDGLVCRRDKDRTPLGLIECKTSALDWEWGDEGSDQVPLGYRYQAQWSMDTLGLPVCHFSVLTSRLVFRRFEVKYDPEMAAWLREEAEIFLASIASGQRPSVDEHAETYRAVRALHPLIDDVAVIIPTALAHRYAQAQRDLAAAGAAKQAAVTEIADRLGSARRAVTEDDVLVAYRKPVANSTPCLAPAPGLTKRFIPTESQESS